MRCSKLIVFLIFVLSPTVFGTKNVRKLSSQLNKACLYQFEGPRVGMSTSQLGKALVCGQSLPAGELRNLFIDLGLYHVLVVSGAHLTWVTAIIMFLIPGTTWLSLSLLIVFTLMTGAQAPVVRALLEVLLGSLKAPGWLLQILAVLGSLVYCPSWIQSRSLFLSALARQAIRKDAGLLVTTLKIQLILTPLLIDTSNFSIPGVLGAALLSMFVELVLFPLLLVVFLIPEIADWFELPLNSLLGLLKELHSMIPVANSYPVTRLPYPVWLYWMIAALIMIFFEIRRRRTWYFSSRF